MLRLNDVMLYDTVQEEGTINDKMCGGGQARAWVTAGRVGQDREGGMVWCW